MLKYQFLTIKHPEDELVGLLKKMKEATKGAFLYQKTLALDYAKNIFMTVDHVGCFKTRRTTLAESSVWVIIIGNELKVTNITPSSVSSLGIIEYNQILKAFFYDFIVKFIDETWTDSVSISGKRITLSDMLSTETYNALLKWESSCNKGMPISHPFDRERWMDFVSLLHKDGTELSVSDFAQWLSEDRKWPVAYNDQIFKLENYLEYSLDLLDRYDGTDI